MQLTVKCPDCGQPTITADIDGPTLAIDDWKCDCLCLFTRTTELIAESEEQGQDLFSWACGKASDEYNADCEQAIEQALAKWQAEREEEYYERHGHVPYRG